MVAREAGLAGELTGRLATHNVSVVGRELYGKSALLGEVKTFSSGARGWSPLRLSRRAFFSLIVLGPACCGGMSCILG